MNNFYIYLLSSSACLAVLYLFHKWVWSSEKRFSISRTLLLLIPIISFIIPIIPWQTLFSMGATDIEAPIYEALLTANLNGFLVEIEPVAQNYSIWSFLLIIPLVGMLVVFVMQNWEKVRIFQYIKKHKATTTHIEPNIKLIIVDDINVVPFSWQQYIVLSKEDYKQNGAQILAHEMAHIHLKHTWDLEYINLIIVLQWFNPAAWLLKRELQLVHEYQADNRVIQSGINAQSYQLLLIKKSVGNYMFNLGNSFNHGHLQKRIYMMLNKKQNRWAVLKLLYVLPAILLLGIFIGSNTSIKAIAKSTTTDAVLTTPQQVLSNQEEALLVADEMPQFPGGIGQLMKFLGTNIKYPKDAVDKKLEGRVIVSFVVYRTGETGDFNIIHSVDPSLDAEAIRVLGMMPKWTPGKLKGQNVNVKYTIPVTFRLNKKTKVEKTSTPDAQEVFMVVEEMPEFPGGLAELMKFLGANIKYPKEAVDKRIQGRVTVSFVVDKTGETRDFNIIRSLDPILDAEALRVLKEMPKWTPGKQRGEAVSVKYTVPVTFRLPKEDKAQANITQPVYADGESGLMKHLSMNVKYPAKAQESNTQGKVIVRFVVNTQGNVENIQIEKGVSKELDAEVTRVVSTMSKWTPGKENGKDVAMNVTLPFIFKLKGSNQQSTEPIEDNAIIVVGYASN